MQETEAAPEIMAQEAKNKDLPLQSDGGVLRAKRATLLGGGGGKCPSNKGILGLLEVNLGSG